MSAFCQHICATYPKAAHFAPPAVAIQFYSLCESTLVGQTKLLWWHEGDGSCHKMSCTPLCATSVRARRLPTSHSCAHALTESPRGSSASCRVWCLGRPTNCRKMSQLSWHFSFLSPSRRPLLAFADLNVSGSFSDGVHLKPITPKPVSCIFRIFRVFVSAFSVFSAVLVREVAPQTLVFVGWEGP